MSHEFTLHKESLKRKFAVYVVSEKNEKKVSNCLENQQEKLASGMTIDLLWSKAGVTRGAVTATRISLAHGKEMESWLSGVGDSDGSRTSGRNYTASQGERFFLRRWSQ